MVSNNPDITAYCPFAWCDGDCKLVEESDDGTKIRYHGLTGHQFRSGTELGKPASVAVWSSLDEVINADGTVWGPHKINLDLNTDRLTPEDARRLAGILTALADAVDETTVTR